MSAIPKSLKGILWSRKLDKLDPQKDKSYIVNQILSFGSLKNIHWMLKKYSKKEVEETFVKKPRKVYTHQSFNFVKNHILKITRELNSRKYVKSLY